MANFYVTAELDDVSADMGWDGDMPLDADKNWTPYTLFLYAYADDCEHGHSGECRDSISSVWVSDDDDGRSHLASVARMYFCSKDDAERPSNLRDIDINFP